MEKKIEKMEGMRKVLDPLKVWEENGRVYVKPIVDSNFISKSTIDKIASACILYGFSGYMIEVTMKEGLKFNIF